MEFGHVHGSRESFHFIVTIKFDKFLHLKFFGINMFPLLVIDPYGCPVDPLLKVKNPLFHHNDRLLNDFSCKNAH